MVRVCNERARGEHDAPYNLLLFNLFLLIFKNFTHSLHTFIISHSTLNGHSNPFRFSRPFPSRRRRLCLGQFSSPFFISLIFWIVSFLSKCSTKNCSYTYSFFFLNCFLEFFELFGFMLYSFSTESSQIFFFFFVLLTIVILNPCLWFCLRSLIFMSKCIRIRVMFWCNC